MILYTLHEAAAILKVSPKTVRVYIETGKLVAGRLGKTGPYRIEESAMREFMGLPEPENKKQTMAKEETFEERESRMLRTVRSYADSNRRAAV